MSSDAGLTWTFPQNPVSWALTSPNSNRLQAVTDSQGVYVTWDGTQEDEYLEAEVHFRRYNLKKTPAPDWDAYQLITDGQSGGDTVRVFSGDYPDIALSNKDGTRRIHIAFRNERGSTIHAILSPTIPSYSSRL